MDLRHMASPAPVYDAEPPGFGAARVPARACTAPVPGPVCGDAALDALEAQITEVWGHINAATAHFLTLVAEFDRSEGWARHGLASCAQWLNWQCGIGRVAAREKVRTARALASLPKIAEAFGEGRLSYSKVRALTRVATAATEETLLHIALSGTAAHVERAVRAFRRVQRESERDEAEAIHERRYLDCRRESNGSVTLEARLTPEAGEMLLKALEAADAQLEERGGEAGSDEAQPHGSPGDIEHAEAAQSASSACGSVSAETPPRPAGPVGWRRSIRRAALPSTPAPPAAAGPASAWTTTSPSKRCAGKQAITERHPVPAHDCVGRCGWPYDRHLQSLTLPLSGAPCTR